MRFPAVTVAGHILDYCGAVNEAVSFPTATAVIRHYMRPGYNVLVVKLTGKDVSEGAVIANLNYDQACQLVSGSSYSPVLPFFGKGCACTSKATVVSNYPLRSLALASLDAAKYGAQSVSREAPSLALTLMLERSEDEITDGLHEKLQRL